MSDLKKHGWKLVVIFVLFGLVGRMDYEHEVKHEAVAKAYYDELNQRYGRTHTAHLSRVTRTGEYYEHHDYDLGRVRDWQDN